MGNVALHTVSSAMGDRALEIDFITSVSSHSGLVILSELKTSLTTCSCSSMLSLLPSSWTGIHYCKLREILHN